MWDMSLIKAAEIRLQVRQCEEPESFTTKGTHRDNCSRCCDGGKSDQPQFLKICLIKVGIPSSPCPSSELLLQQQL